MLVQAVCGGSQISYQGQSIDLGQPFRRASMHELVQDKLGQLFFTSCPGLPRDFGHTGEHQLTLFKAQCETI